MKQLLKDDLEKAEKKAAAQPPQPQGKPEAPKEK